MTVVSESEQVFLSMTGRRAILSLQIVRNWLACLSNRSKDTISSDSNVGGLLCVIEL